jgi:hypothetical protein
MSISLLRQLLMKEAVKKSAGASGIMTINKGIAADVEKLVQKYVNDALAQGVDLDTLSESQLKYIIELNKPKTPKVFFGQEAADQLNKLFPKKGEVIPLPMKRTFKQEIEAMKKSGDLVDEDNMIISKKITDRDMFKKANEKFQKPIKEKQDMGEFGEINVETDYSTSINRPEFFDPKAKNMYGKTVKIGVEFIEKEKERILNTINRKKKEMVPRTHSNYKLLKKSLQDQEDALEAIKITEDLGGNENMFDFLRTQNISDYSSKPLKRSNYVKTDAEIKAEIEAGNKKGIEAIKKGKLDDDPENMATGGRAGYAVGNQVMPAVDARMNLDYNTLINKNEAQRVTQAQNRNPGIMRPTMADVAGAVQTDPRAGIKEAFLNERLSGGERFGDAIPDFDSYGTYTGSDQLLKDYAAAGRGTPSSQLVRLPEGNPYAYSGPGYYEYDGSSFSKTADLNMTPEYEKMIRSNYNLNQINQTGMPRAITQDDIDTFNFTQSNPMMTGFDYSKENNWSPGQPAPDGYRVVDMMGDQFLERMYPSKEEVAGLAGMMPSLIPTSTSTLNPDAGLSGQEYAEKYGLEYAKGGRAGYYTGGMVDVEPSLSDIGHGSDALMARTRLMSPGSQTTTSTGLNYLLAEDNDNIRVPFAGGGGGRRAFLKLLAALGGGIAGIKTGILGFSGKEGAKKAITETVKQSAGSGTPPPYFFKLVEKIKTLGDDTLATQDKSIAKKYKDYTLEEDFSGNIEIIKKSDDVAEDVYMSYKVEEVPLKNKKGSSKVEEYEEFTARPDVDGKMKDVEPGVPDEVVQEGTVFEDNLTEFGMTKKADGGRIGFSAGNLAKLGITGSSRRFLEKVFGKERFANMIENDPRLHRGMLEVVEMFRKKDKEGLKMYLQKFLPQMDDATVEDFIVGSGDTSGIQGQLIRLGSGREYKDLGQLIKQADEVRKLEDFDIKNVSKNAEGGRIGFSGGGIFRSIIAKAAAAKGMKPYEFIKVTSYKSLPPEVKMFLSAEDFARLKSGQKDMYSNYIDMAKTRLDFQKQIEGGKTTPAKPLFESMEKTMDKQSYVPKTVTADDIAEMELMVKKRFNKDRKDNAEGGLQTMLGE